MKKSTGIIIGGITFTLFAISDTVASYHSNSISLFGDSVALFVDCVSLFYEMFLEAEPWVSLPREKKVTLNLINPLFKLFILFPLLFIIFSGSIYRLTEYGDEFVREDIMLSFSTTNLTLDFFNILCLSRLCNFLGYDFIDEEDLPPKDLYAACKSILADTLRSLTILLFSLRAYLDADITSGRSDAIAGFIIIGIIAISTIPTLAEFSEKLKDFYNIHYSSRQSRDDILKIESETTKLI